MTVKPLLTTETLRDYLGCELSWIYDNIRSIPHKRLGREYRFRQSEIDAWLDLSHEGFPLKLLKAS